MGFIIIKIQLIQYKYKFQQQSIRFIQNQQKRKTRLKTFKINCLKNIEQDNEKGESDDDSQNDFFYIYFNLMNSLDLLSENYNFEGSANMLKNKVIVKKSAFAKHSLQNPSTLKVPIVKKDSVSSTQGSTKQDVKIKPTPYTHSETSSTLSQKPSFLKSKIEKNNEVTKKKDELDKIIYQKCLEKEKNKIEKKIETRQSFNEKYNDYFEFKANPKQDTKKYGKILSDSGDSVKSKNSIQSQGSKRIIVKRYEPMPKQIDSQKQKPILYETKNEKSPLNTAKNLVKPKQGMRNHGRMRSTLDNQEQFNKVKLTQMKSLSPKPQISQIKKTPDTKINIIKSVQGTQKLKSNIKKSPKKQHLNLQNKFNKKSIGKQSAGSLSNMDIKSKSKIEINKNKMTYTNKKRIPNPPVKPATKSQKNNSYVSSKQSNGSLSSINKNIYKTPDKSQKSKKVEIKAEKKMQKKNEPFLKLNRVGQTKQLILKVLKKLAEHDESVTYLCLHEETDLVFCIKKCFVKGQKIQQIIRQIKISTVMCHPNLVKTYCAFYDKDHLYLMMQYMDDKTLFHTLQEKTCRFERIETNNSQSRCPLTTHLSKINKVRETIKQIVKGLSYLHEKGVIHRDIKPQNIFISHETFKVGDFGSSTFNNSQEYIGTLDYASPEILQKKPYDYSIDMWSLGCVAYELDVGRPPFFHIDRNQTIRRIVNIEYDSSVVSDPQLKDLVQKLLIIPGSLRLTAQQVLDHPFIHQLIQSRARS